MQISIKKRRSKANFDHLWHEKPNLPPCIAHPTQDPPAHIELSFVTKDTKEKKKVEENLLSARMVLLELNNSDCEDALLHVLRLVCRLVDHQVST